MNTTYKMMSLKSLICFLAVVIHTVNAMYPEELLKLSRNLASEVDLDSVKDLLTDALAEEIKTEIFNKASSSSSEEETETETEHRPKTEKSGSESRMEGSWLDLDSEPSSVYVDDPDENDALYSSRDVPNPSKRDDYYDSLEKKSQRSTYVPPPRKNFYDTPTDIMDSSSSEEHYREERRPEHARPPPRVMDDHDDFHYHPQLDSLADVIHAESHPLLESLHLLPSHALYQQRAMQTPPWRYTQGKAYPRKQPPPLPPPVAPPMPEEQPKSPPQQQPSPDPMVGKVHKKRGPYKKSSTAPRRPVPAPVPVHMTKMHHHDDFKFKSLPRSKPSWTADYKIKEPITPKLTAPDDSSFHTPSAMGKPIRQQFHEQGTRGPHSYKFGYSTGDIDNPMARYEERDSDGIVRGSYSYVDPRGQKQVIHYESHPKFGFKTRTSPNF